MTDDSPSNHSKTSDRSENKKTPLITMDEKGRLPHILVVEDQDFNRKLIVLHLKRDGFTKVDEAGDGETALKLIDKNDYDLVLTDLQMPHMNGIDLLLRIKENPKSNALPVVVVSASEEVASIAKSIKLGAEDHLPKPFEPMILRARVVACLEKKRLRDLEQKYLMQIEEERNRADHLLNIILPAPIAAELKEYGDVRSKRIENVGVLFCDIVNFTSYSASHSAEEVVSRLRVLFEQFEDVMVRYNMEKIKTIGDEFMAAVGLIEEDPTPFATIMNAGLDMIAAAKDTELGWEVRASVHVGPVLAGVVGKMKYQYDIWGNTVNLAARLTAHADPGTVAFLKPENEASLNKFLSRSIGVCELKGMASEEVIECYGRVD